jgi:demethylmenaquinone methyltransferase/2-methoxy-6-polyprenyl-1,4-benzoquinol methylase
MSQKTHFGFKEVEVSEKEPLVQEIFTNVASKYDIMNDFMSLGIHKLWKNEMMKEIAPADHEVLLDLAGGTGDIAARYIAKGGKKVIVSDLNEEMLKEGKKKLNNPKISWVQANAEQLPFEDDSFDYCTISFGIRNVTNIQKALHEVYRILKPGGKFVCLEFSNVEAPIVKQIYDFYSFKIIPNIGKIITGNKDAYTYLVESIKQFPKATVFLEMLKKAGFDMAEFRKLSFGIVAIHRGFKV